ncbi:MAG: 50S ribosomal protein L29 [Candidatus Falkowbacteria bacterium]
MKIKELKNTQESELQHLLSEARSKLRDMRFKNASGQLKDVREIRENKKLVARILTLLNITRK